MKLKRCLSSLLVFIVLFAAYEIGGTADPLRKEIDYLIQYVKTSDVVFIRNNREHSPQEAAAHILKKYDHFKEKIKTTGDFIRLTATKSMVTGTPYKIRTESGEVVLACKWIEKALERYREQNSVTRHRVSGTAGDE
jgi:hypothetical protein